MIDSPDIVDGNSPPTADQETAEAGSCLTEFRHLVHSGSRPDRGHPLLSKGAKFELLPQPELPSGGVDQATFTVQVSLRDLNDAAIHTFEFLPPEGGWKIPEDPEIESTSVMRERNPGLGDWISFMVQERGFMPTRIVPTLLDVQAAGYWGNWSGLSAYSSEIRPYDCTHEYFDRGIDCKRYE